MLAIILILALSIFTDIFKAAILILIFTPSIVYTLRASKFIPHLNIETLSASTLLLGYLHGPMIAFIFALAAGMYGLLKSNFIRYLMIVRIIVTAIVGAIMAFFTSMNFNTNFIVGILVMNVLLYFIYMVIDPDIIQNYTHRASHLIWNLLVVRFIFILIYDLIVLI